METSESGIIDNVKIFAMKYRTEFGVAAKKGVFRTLKWRDQWSDIKEHQRNIQDHELKVAMVSETLAVLLNLPQVETQNLIKAMLLHDVNKIEEREQINAARKSGSLDLQKVIEIKKSGDEFLRENGYSEEIIKLIGAIVQPDDNPPDSLAEKIAWLSDAIVEGTKIVTIRDRFRLQLSGHNTGGIDEKEMALIRRAYFMALSYKEKTHDIVQQEIGHKICVEFSEKLGFEGDPDDLPLFIKDKFEKRIGNS